MFQPKAKHLLIVLLLGLVLTFSASESQAGWRHGCGWGGCNWGGWGWGGWGWDGCDSCGGWYAPYTAWNGGCGWGCGRMVGLHRWRSACWGCGCNPCSCGGWGWADDCCDVPSCGCGDVGVGAAPALAPTPAPAQPAPAQPGAPSLPPEPAAPQQTPGAPSTGTSTDFFPSRETSGLLTVYVPADAQVTVNGLLTKSTGSKREYVSHNLKPGLTYKYQVTVQVVRDGKVLKDSKLVTLTAGSQEGLAFSFNPKMDEQLAQY